MTHPFRDPHNPEVPRSAGQLAGLLGMELDPWQRRALDLIEAAPPAPESFIHRTTCDATDDAPALCGCPPAVLPDVLGEVAVERSRQDQLWGEQNHPDLAAGIVGDSQAPGVAARFYGLPTAPVAKRDTDLAADTGDCTWAHIAVEELAEAVESASLGDEEAVRAEVVQLAAVCVAWVQAIDRRAVR